MFSFFNNFRQFESFCGVCFRMISVVSFAFSSCCCCCFLHTSFELSCARVCASCSTLWFPLWLRIFFHKFWASFSFELALVSLPLPSLCVCVLDWWLSGFSKNARNRLPLDSSVALPHYRSPTLPYTLPLSLSDSFSPSRRRSNEAAKNIFVNGTFWFSLAFGLANLCTTHTLTHIQHTWLCVCVCICFEVNLWKCWTKNSVFSSFFC